MSVPKPATPAAYQRALAEIERCKADGAEAPEWALLDVASVDRKLELMRLSLGHQALEEIEQAAAERRPPADWALKEVVRCYRHFKTGRPVGGFIKTPSTIPPASVVAGWLQPYDDESMLRVDNRTKAPATLDEAFGMPPLKGQQLLKKHQRAVAAQGLQILFTGERALPRDEKGFKVAAEKLGLTEDQVRKWLPVKGKS